MQKRNVHRANVHRARCGSTGFRIYRYGLCIGFAILLFAATQTLAQEWRYTDSSGTGEYDLVLVELPIANGRFENSLVPGNTNPLLSNNLLRINYTTVGTKTDPYNILGGYAYVNQDDTAVLTATENRVALSGESTVEYNVSGVYASVYQVGTAVLTATKNSVDLSGESTVKGQVHGGITIARQAGTAVLTATENSVTLSGESTLKQGAFGGFAESGLTENAEMFVNNNSVALSGENTLEWNVYGGYARVYRADTAEVFANDNSVVLNDKSTVKQDVFGGHINFGNTGNTSETANLTVANNSVALNDEASARNVYGGYALVNRTDTVTLTVNENSVALRGEVKVAGSTSEGNIYGGYAQVNQAGTANVTANENHVTISENVTIEGSVYGGYAYAMSNGNDAVATATGNTVNISGDVIFGQATTLFGGWVSTPDGDAFTGNTLNLSSTIEVSGVQNFEFYNFTLPEEMVPNEAMLTVRDTVALGNGAEKDSKITVSTLGGKAPLLEGSEIMLIKVTGASNITGGFAPTGTGTHGATLGYTFGISLQNNDQELQAAVTSVQARNESKILSEGFLAGSILLNQTGDLIAERTGKHGGLFFDFAGGSSRYNTGSHIDMKGFSLLTGLTRCTKMASGRMVYGAFFEYGNGNDTGLYVTGARGNSDVYHYGGGVLGRLNLRNAFYAEGSFRAGAIDNGFTSNLRDSMGNAAGYDSSSAYVGTHVGLGRMLKLSSYNTVDVYGKYFWTHQGSDNVTLSTNDPVRFNSIDSHRLRLGGRSNYVVNRRLSTYLGAAWEHEFNGVAKSTTYGYGIDAPSLRGSTGIGELGVTVSRSARGALPVIDLGVQGYIGKREGVAGSAQIRWAW